MASCSFNHNGRTFTLTVSNGSYSIENNTSDVNWTLSISGGGTVEYDSHAKVNINGSTVYERYAGWGSGFPAADGSVSGTVSGIAHDSSGNATISFELWGYSYVYSDQYTSGSMALTTIPRTSTPTLSASSVEAGKTVKITTNRASSSFTHTLQYSIGSASGTIATSVGASYTWTVPTSLCNQIPSATSGKVTITCTTYNGSTKIGSKTVSLTITVPSSAIPTISSCSVGIATESGIASGYLVKGLTVPKFTVTAAGVYSSTVSKYQVTIDSKSYTNTSKVVTSTKAFASSGTVSYTVKVTDSRGRTASKSFTCTVYKYSAPSVSLAITVDGTSVSTTFSANVYSVNQKNTKALTIVRTKVSTSETETYTAELDDWTVTDGAQTFTGSWLQTIEDVNEETYSYTAVVTDKINSATATKKTAEICLSLMRGGTGAAFFGEATEDGLAVYGNGNAHVKAVDTTSKVAALLNVGSSHYNHGIYSNGYSTDGETLTEDGAWIIYRNKSGTVVIPLDLTASKSVSAASFILGSAALSSWKDMIKVSTKKVTVSGTSSTSLSAPSVSGYTFVCWLNVSSISWVGTPYIEDPTEASTTIWDASYHAKSGDSYYYTARALYVKTS